MAKKKAAAAKTAAKQKAAKKTTSFRKAVATKGTARKATKKTAKAVPSIIVPTAPEDPQMDRLRKEIRKNWDVLNVQRMKAEEVLDEWRAELLATPGVTGCHVGLRRVKKQIVFPLSFCIRVHVGQKLQPNHPQLLQMLPSARDGVSVDIHEASYRLAAGVPPEETCEAELIGGIAIAFEDTTANWGTLGLCVTSNEKLVMLTNKHVAGENGNAIVQPPSKVVPGGSPIIGKVLAGIRNAIVDCAIVESDGSRPVKAGIKVGASVLPGKFEAGELDIFDQLFRTTVFKIGAATGSEPIRIGRVRTINGSVTIPVFGPLSSQIIVDSINGNSIIQGGDSGSVLIKQVVKGNSIRNFVVGLVTAQMDGGLGLVASHFREVRNKLGISIS